ncbi:MAG: FtsW/RodA/SpoVE family cell cycle protein [Lachnospiraceae bacterium]
MEPLYVRGYRAICRQIQKVREIFSFFYKTAAFYMILLEVAMLLIVYPKKSMEPYLDMLLILILMTVISYFFIKRNNGNIKILNYTIVLVTVGVMLQSIFKQELFLKNAENIEGRVSMASLQIQYILAFVLAILASSFYCSKWGKILAKDFMIRTLFYISILFYIITLVMARAVGGGVRNWIMIGGFSLQLSEVNKLLYIVVIAGILCSVKNPSKKRIISVFFVTFCHFFFLTAQGEFGTLILIFLLFLVFLFLFVPDLRVFFVTFVSFVGLGSVVIFLGFFLEKMVKTSQFLSNLGIVQFYLRNFQKIQNRFLYFLDPASDAGGGGYQLLKGRDAIMLGGWLGSDAITELPVKTSDMVYPALIERCGILIAILVFIVFVLLWLEGLKVFITRKDRFHQGVCVGIISVLFYQTLIIIGGSCGMCPLTGITLPFISSGGSSLVVCFVMMALVIGISGNVDWKGEKNGEEARKDFEFIKKDSNIAKCLSRLCNTYDINPRRDISRIAGNFSRGRSKKVKSGMEQIRKGIYKRLHFRQKRK